MSSSSPGDLAVTFRSIDRRLTEALGFKPSGQEVGDQLAAAAAVVNSDPNPASIADAITSRRAKEWNEQDLDTLRAIALEIGRRIRSIAERRADEE